MAANEEKELWDSYNGKGFAAEYSKYSVRSTADEAGNDIQATYATKDDTQAGLDSKVDKVEGKGLSENDFTDADKANLDANTTARHTHANKATLDKIPATDGHDYGSVMIVGNNGTIVWEDDEYEEYNFNVVTVGGRDYPTVRIGNQIWMAENLDWKFSGLVITGNPSWSEPRAQYYDGSEATYGVNGNKYGLLYNYAAAAYIEANKATILPSGWRVPSKTDFDTLVSAVSTNSGTKLKSTAGWYNNGNGTDDFGFNAKPAGYISTYYFDVSKKAFFVSATSNGGNGYYRLKLDYNAADTNVNSESKDIMGSLRLVRDAT